MGSGRAYLSGGLVWIGAALFMTPALGSADAQSAAPADTARARYQAAPPLLAGHSSSRIAGDYEPAAPEDNPCNEVPTLPGCRHPKK